MVITITIILIVCTIVSIKATLTIRENDKRIQQLENELNEYYNRRENRLLKRFKDIENETAS